MINRHMRKPAGVAADAGTRGGTVWSIVGRRLAQRRGQLGCSASRIADGVGITVEDYTGYETGTPVPALLLGEIADLLDCPVTWFFEGIDEQPAQDDGAVPDARPVAYTVATVEHRIQALTDSFRKLDFEGQQHLLAISRALSRASGDLSR